MTKKYFLCFLLMLLCAGTLIAQNLNLTQRYLDAANNSLSKQEYKKAFDYVNQVLSRYEENKVPQNVELLAEDIYYNYLVQIRDNRDMESFAAVKDKLLEYDYLSTERVSRLVRAINTLESQNIETNTVVGPVHSSSSSGATSGSSSGSSSPVYISSGATSARVTQLQRQLDEANKKLAMTEGMLKAFKEISEKEKSEAQKEKEENLLAEQQRLEKQKEMFETALKATQGTTRKGTTYILLIVSALVVLSIIIFVVLLMVGAQAAKTRKEQEEKLEATMQLVSQIASGSGGGAIGIEGPGASNFGTVALPSPELSDAAKNELSMLSIECEKIGSKIDKITGRKNNSKNVAEIAFKIANFLRLSSYEASLYFCVAMVYDVGFCDVNPELFTVAGRLTNEEKQQIRDHVVRGLDEIGFVPTRFKGLFHDAIYMHHENMDGSGYPEGLTGEEIPVIAKIIRVAESYVALVSRRNYKNIFDKETAVEELKKHPELYDQRIVIALESVI